MQQRYGQLIDLVHEAKPRTIIEIGVWNGGRAIEMAKAALQHQLAVHYTGYDLFETASATTDKEEFNKKPHNSLERVRARLLDFQEQNPGFTFDLVKGNTRETLKPSQHAADFAYIDGGHSVETIRGDYEAVQGSGVVVFDDYYEPNQAGDCPDLALYGANAVVDAIEGAEILRCGDIVAGGGHICLAVVRQEKASAEAA